MKKVFLFTLLACFSCVMAFAEDVATLSELQTALAAGGEITLTANIDAGTTQLTIAKGVTLNGGEYCIKGTNTYVFQVNTAEKVVMKDLVIWAAKTSKQGRGILIDNNTDNAKLTLNNVTINATYRAMDVWYSDNVTLEINNCLFQNVQGQAVDAKGNPTEAKYNIELTGTNAGDTRGLNFGRLTNSTITINNSTMQGFFYVLNNVTGDNGNMTGSTLTANNSTFKGRAALNVWGYGAEYEFSDCSVIGINNYGGGQEVFSCFVFNNQNTCYDNTLTINGGTFVSTVFDEVGGSNPNAAQYLLSVRRAGNTVVVNNSQYSCTKELGDTKGGISDQIRANSSITINDGVYNCPNLLWNSYSASGVTGDFIINGGQYNLSVVSPNITDGDIFSAVTIKGGTFNLDMATPVDPADEDNGLIADGFKQVTNANGTYSIVPEDTKTTEAPVEEEGTTEISWNDETAWGEADVPDAETSVSIGNGTSEVVATVAKQDTAQAYRIDLADNVTLKVDSAAFLTIGEGGIIASENAEIVVADGGALVLNGLIQGTENVVIEASENSNTTVLINPDINVYGDEHPLATYKFKSQAKYDDVHKKYTWQRFGVPTFNGATKMTWQGEARTALFRYDYDADDWAAITTETAHEFNITGLPFACYNMTIDRDPGEDGIIYEFTGELMGNSDAPLQFVKGWNYYANSYTAPIDVRSLVIDIFQKFGQGVEATVFVYDRNGDGTTGWSPINGQDLIDPDEETVLPVISPMQAFILYVNNHNLADGEVNYRNNVYNPFLGIEPETPSFAPSARDANSYNKASLIFTDGVQSEKLNILQGEEFSDEFDNFYDATKFESGNNFSVYCIEGDTKLSAIATNDLTDKVIAFDNKVAGTYTLTVASASGETIKLYDAVTKQLIDLEKGATYEFTAEAVNDAQRFIINPSDAPSAIDNTEIVLKATKFVGTDGQIYVRRGGNVYTIQGQQIQ